MKRLRSCCLSALFAASIVDGVWCQTTELVSRNSNGVQSNGQSYQAALSADGLFVAYASNASNLVSGPDANGPLADVFIYCRLNGTTLLVDVSTAGVQANDNANAPSISSDGRFVAFESSATNLLGVPDANGGLWDVFVHDCLTGTTELVSQSTAGIQGNSGSFGASISADGRYVAFWSGATNLTAGADANGGYSDVFVRDRQSGTTELISLSTSGVQGDQSSFGPSISADGRYVAFTSQATNLLGIPDANGQARDVFVRDRLNGTTELISLSSSGLQGNYHSEGSRISSDGRFVAFESQATNLMGGPDANGNAADVFVRDRQAQVTELMSQSTAGVQGNGYSVVASISEDGRFVCFQSQATNLLGVPDANGSTADVFLRDRQARTTELVSVGNSGVQGNGDSFGTSVSADGRQVAFASLATNLISHDANGTVGDVFVRDRGVQPILASCFGDGTNAACPCANNGFSGHGCENSAATGGAFLSASGSTSLTADSLVLTSVGETPTALSIFLQGSTLGGPTNYGDGLRCAGTALKRLYVKSAISGVVIAPRGTDPSISARSAALGGSIPLGATRHYQTYYRDSVASFCPNPGSTFNISNALSAVWGP